MFTGLVEAVGTVETVRDLPRGRRLLIRAPGVAPELSLGESVALDGTCLTAVELAGDSFAVEVVGATLSRTVAGGYGEGTRVNLERALRLGDRLGGHWVQGHVDGVGRFTAVHTDGETHLMDFALPPDVARRTIAQGSVTISGVSLTVSRLDEEVGCRVAVIPHTWVHTNLSDLAPGDPVNVEGDVLGRYVERLLEGWQGDATRAASAAISRRG